MTGKRRVPLGKKVRDEQMRASLEREARRASKRGRARDRAAWNETLAAGVDAQGLSDAMTQRLVAQDEAEAAAAKAGAKAPRASARRGGARAAPGAGEGGGQPVRRWVPIGPSVVRRGQAMDRPRVTGRIRDIQVDPTGTRAYAGSAMGGVWYTEDGGATWAPVGAWAERRRQVGGVVNAQAIGSLLVTFGGTAATDVVLAGTGEIPLAGIPNDARATGEALGGTGILSALHPMTAAGPDPWEPDAGLAQFEGLATMRLIRRPGSVPGKSLPPASPLADQDVVVACTTGGAFVGIRQPLPAAGGLPARDGFLWDAMPAMVAAHPNATVSDAVWLPGGRLVMAVVGTGLVYTDDLGATLVNIRSTQAPAVVIAGVMSLASGSGNRVFLLGETAGTPTLWHVPDATIPTPVATAVSTALPVGLWTGQRDYDQAVAVDPGVGFGGTDRVYIGGSVAIPRAGGDWGAALYCWDVVGPAPFALQPAAGISTTAAPTPPPPSPPVGAGADRPGLIGNNVHGDVHCIRITGAAPPARQVWVGSDGGVFVSDRSGRVQTFTSANTGLATLQPTFARSHPVLGHVVAAGMQDNGTQVRTGDTVWEERYEGDGGGVAFAPGAPNIIVRQYIQGWWNGTVAGSFVDPLTRVAGGVAAAFPNTDSENGWSAFYSGIATTSVPVTGPNPAHPRVAIGTYRIWVSDNLGVVNPTTWNVLPFPNGAPTDPRPGGAWIAANQGTGMPSAPWPGPVITLAWASPRELLVVYRSAIARYTEAPVGTWTAKIWQLTNRRVAIPRTTIPTDICPVPGARNFYVTTTGVVGGNDETVWFYSPADDQFHATALRHQLDTPPPPAPPVTVGPRDPAYSVVVDSADPTVVFVGTATGVWRGQRQTAQGAHVWHPYVDGLPEASVQDLHVWVDPTAPTPYTATTPRVLRAGVQARGIWEVDLAADTRRSTWIRGTAWDNRRLPLAPSFDATLTPPVPAQPLTASPDIVVRPRWPRTVAPSFIGGPTISAGLAPAYQVWTFQSAFRWLYPSVRADGQWTDALANLVSLHRTTMALPALPQINAAVWANVVGGVRVRANGVVTTDLAAPLAVYRAPWHTSRAAGVAPTEIDFMESVVPPRAIGPIWEVYRETSTVDVLVHHRDGRAAPVGTTFVVLLWRSGATPAALMGLSPTDVLTFLTGGALGAAPAGWNVATTGIGGAMQQLTVPVDARLPRGVSIDVDLSAPAIGPHVLFVAYVGSSVDDVPMAQPSMSTTANVPPATISDLVTCWPYSAARVVSIANRPV